MSAEAEKQAIKPETTPAQGKTSDKVSQKGELKTEDLDKVSGGANHPKVNSQ